MNTFPAPSVGDVVLLKASFVERGVVRTKVRPAIVLKVNEPNRMAPHMCVIVARGTTNDRSVLSYEFAITKRQHPREFERAGIREDTTFKLKDLITAPWNEANFAVPANRRFGNTPKIGSLHPASETRCEEAYRGAVEYEREQQRANRKKFKL